MAKQNCCLPLGRKGLKRKSRSARESTHEELERKARFFCGNPQKNAPKFRTGVKLQRGFGTGPSDFAKQQKNEARRRTI
jgi:hypothetical protein